MIARRRRRLPEGDLPRPADTAASARSVQLTSFGCALTRPTRSSAERSRRPSDFDNSKSRTSKFSAIRVRLFDFGNTMLPICRCQRMITWAGRLSVRLGGDRDHRLVEQRGYLPWPSGPQASMAAAAVRRAYSVHLRLLVGRVQLDLVDDRNHIRLQAGDSQVRNQKV